MTNSFLIYVFYTNLEFDFYLFLNLQNCQNNFSLTTSIKHVHQLSSNFGLYDLSRIHLAVPF